MEIAITPEIRTYSGGLGVLAGDTLRAAADLGLQLLAVTLAHRKGYFKQRLDENGVQSEEDRPWNLEYRLTPEEPVVTVLIEGPSVAIRAWRYDMEGITGHTIPIYLLDTDLEQRVRVGLSPIRTELHFRGNVRIGGDPTGIVGDEDFSASHAR